MLMQKREQAYYDVFSYFLMQTLKEKKNIEENSIILQQFISTAEQCLKSINAQNINRSVVSSDKHQGVELGNKPIVLLRRKVESRRAKLIVNSKTKLTVSSPSDQLAVTETKTAVFQKTTKADIANEKANRRCILAEKESDSVSVTTSILINPNQENIPKKTDESYLALTNVTDLSEDPTNIEQWSKLHRSEYFPERFDLKPPSHFFFTNKRLCHSHDNFKSHKHSKSVSLPRDHHDQSKEATSVEILDRTLSASDFCLVYDPVSFANTVVKKKKWLSGSRDCDVFGDYYFCRTNWKPNVVKQAMTNLGKRCRQSMLDLSLSGSKDINGNKEYKKSRTSHLRSAIGRLLSRLRRQDKPEEKSILSRSWSTPYNLNNI